ncbi:hypothetical protein [Deinococcus malanensis]|uniref:hypothetical protein n=1 Tax=Deinococcus malanensis TaxID=1706855 RepID=UPI00166BC19B|nr:hypothetical protein [Deinococcus malanensis]
MPENLLAHVIATAQTLARDLGDDALLDRLPQLRHRAHLDCPEDLQQLLHEYMLINHALCLPVHGQPTLATRDRLPVSFLTRQAGSSDVPSKALTPAHGGGSSATTS